MKIINLTGKKIICLIDQIDYAIPHKGAIEANDFETIKFCHQNVSYSTDSIGNSKILKLLSSIGDPFKLRKEYHLVLDFEIKGHQLMNTRELVITSETKYADYEIRTYYEYFLVKCDGIDISPRRVFVRGSEKIKQEFITNARKLKWWNVVEDGIIEPVLFEAVGLFLIYKVLSFSIGVSAWFIILPFIALDVIILIVKSCKPTAKKWIQRFENYLEESVIRENCYGDLRIKSR